MASFPTHHNRFPNRAMTTQSLPIIDAIDGGGPSCASLLKVLADETRLAVMEQLMAGPRHVGEINGPLAIEPSLLSHHLKVLRDAGLVTAERDGKQVLY